MTDQPDDHSSQNPSERPPLADQIRAKLDEYDVDRHLNEAKAGDLAHEYRGDIERLIEQAASAVDRRTDGRHAETISQVRGSLERGVEKIADQRPGDTPDEAAGPGDDVPPSHG